ncbi:hypothetical protein [Marinomonas sp. TW1]|uniref:hypothetical protein n=1 Tax=Marinomonas sp. TW1 TaxID=1561203 RepID=UPI0007AF2C67|nr:hypothetical protein [Marinomonas sp. TW1]KZN14989.1 hypothetical protein OA79_01875 [Marinomonas sp. TW1]
MMLELLLSAFVFFVLLVGLMLFFVRHQSKLPYYRQSQADWVAMLEKALAGSLPEYEWHAFIGLSIRDNESLDALREQCCWIDEFETKGTQLVKGRLCVSFSNEGRKELEKLLDEWQHKADYLV